MQNLFENVHTVREEEATWSERLPCTFLQSLPSGIPLPLLYNLFIRLQEQNKFYKELLVQVENVSKEIKVAFNTYELLVEQCRKKFGSTVADQQCKRKKKRNAQKELRRKEKKGKKQVRVPTCSEKEPNKEELERSVIDESSTEEEIED